MFVTVRCNWDAHFHCELTSIPGQAKLEIIKFVEFYVPVDFGYTWKPPVREPESRVEPLDRAKRLAWSWPQSRHSDFNRELSLREIFDSDCELTIVVCATPRFSVHLAWYRRILRLINEFIHVYEVMAWLSTLGGAYSAMGDYCDRAKVVAKQISAKQLRLAARLGDPTLVSRCWIFLAMSAIQHGRLQLSRRILKLQWEFAHTREGQRDPRLKNMIRGVWSKLSHEKMLRGSLKLAESLTGQYHCEM
ncbi:hypothetical protein BIW11_12857 [Tropilaelaps mercedesae]|uniref:Uncharacterized protein n=1 Tax=Tropilaelaps mercedesae TaxID=418985 RepID=A0A1V9X4H0_9ACAR|nr:hypothetical protein BIW11_12857 [Tropilaelaps mercedesae]